MDQVQPALFFYKQLKTTQGISDPRRSLAIPISFYEEIGLLADANLLVYVEGNVLPLHVAFHFGKRRPSFSTGWREITDQYGYFPGDVMLFTLIAPHTFTIRRLTEAEITPEIEAIMF